MSSTTAPQQAASVVDQLVDKVKTLYNSTVGTTTTTATSESDTIEPTSTTTGMSTDSSNSATPAQSITNPSTAPTTSTSAETGPSHATGQVSVPLPSSSSSIPTQPVTVPSSSTTTTSSPAFNPAYITVVYVLGGPGAGKGTQCAKLVNEKSFVHLSAGDLLRAEQNREGSKVGQMIKEYIKEGTIVPMEVTIGLLQSAMQEQMDKNNSKRFLIDGFPRQMDQAIKFDETVCPGSAVLFLTCPEETLLERLLERGKTSGRDDDNVESIKKRFRTFIQTSMPVVDYYRKQGKVIDINSSKTIDAVYSDISSAMDGLERRKSISLETATATA